MLRALLLFLALPYGLAVRLRRKAYDLGILKSRKLPFPVISVGNITLGGTGKTPAVMAIAAFIRDCGKKTVILSRGYGRRSTQQIVVVSDGVGLLVHPDEAGDEPALMASSLNAVPVVVGGKRYAAGMVAYERFQSDVAVLDDGFQHIQLHRDLNICLIDGLHPFGTGKLFPAGILREPVSSLRYADAVLITRSDQCPDVALLRERIGTITAAPVFTSRHVATDLIDLADGSRSTLDSLRAAPVLAFSGIAKPASFNATLEHLGAIVKTTQVYPDHYRYTRSDLDQLRGRARDAGASLIVTTEKDSVKLREFSPKGIQALRVRLEIIEKEAWERVLLQRL